MTHAAISATCYFSFHQFTWINLYTPLSLTLVTDDLHVSDSKREGLAATSAADAVVDKYLVTFVIDSRSRCS